MHVLGLSCGSPNGNSEILLKIALKAASAFPETTISFIRIPELSIPSYDLPGTFNPSSAKANPDPSTSKSATTSSTVVDDRPAVLEAILNADGLIVASPIYTRQAAGVLKYFCDKTLGPFVDAAFVEEAIAGKKAGDPRFKDFAADERVLKPRVAALIAVGGATSPEWMSMALPMLHQTVFSLHAKVVDQILVHGTPFPGAVLIEDAVPEEAQKLGKNVASQLGKPYDEAEYLGEKKGSCPHCRLNMIILQFTADNAIECAVCGAKGKLIQGDEGKIQAKYLDEPATSVLTMPGKRRHMAEIKDVGMNLGHKMPGLQPERKKWEAMDRFKVIMPSTKLA